MYYLCLATELLRIIHPFLMPNSSSPSGDQLSELPDTSDRGQPRSRSHHDLDLSQFYDVDHLDRLGMPDLDLNRTSWPDSFSDFFSTAGTDTQATQAAGNKADRSVAPLGELQVGVAPSVQGSEAPRTDIDPVGDPPYKEPSLTRIQQRHSTFSMSGYVVDNGGEVWQLWVRSTSHTLCLRHNGSPLHVVVGFSGQRSLLS